MDNYESEESMGTSKERVRYIMGFRKDWDLNAIKHGIWAMRHECTSSYNDGFVAWGVKQELYELKWLIDESLRKCSTFAPEAEWLKQKEQEKIIEILKR